MLKMNKIQWIVLGVVLLGAGCSRDVSLNKEPVLFEVRQGDTLNKVARRLAEEKIIRDAVRFKVRAKVLGYDRKLCVGTYQILPGENLDSLLHKMATGKVYARMFTVPEGWNIYDIASSLVRQGILTNEEEFLEACRRVDLVTDMGVTGVSTLEGFLFPDTYSVPLNTSAESIVKMMVKQFHKMVTPEMIEAFRSQRLSLLEAVTMASIVEKETGVEYEKPIIAGVIYNRLRLRMKLQVDPTLIYMRILEKTWDGNIRKRDFTNPSPYNTYMHYGLPPAPIANPGKTSLLAVAFPAKTDYLYFVAKGDGSHYFSSTLQEHNQAVQRYQLKRK